MILALVLFFLATMVTSFAGIVSYWLFLRRHTLLGEEQHHGAASIAWSEPAKLLKANPLSTISFWDRLLAKIDYVEVMKRRVSEAGVRWSIGRLTLAMLLAGALSCFFLARVANYSPLTTTVGTVLVAQLPYAYILHLRRKRLAKLESQFSDALDSLARAMRAGNPLVAALEIVAAETAEPLAGEFKLLIEERTLGRSWDDALDSLVRRIPLIEISTFAAALKLQNRTGGKLSEVLARLAETMRDSDALKTEVRSIAAHGKLTGKILTALPLLIAAMMAAVNPSYFTALWAHPNGRDLVAAGAASLCLAHLVIKKMVDIKL